MAKTNQFLDGWLQEKEDAGVDEAGQPKASKWICTQFTCSTMVQVQPGGNLEMRSLKELRS